MMDVDLDAGSAWSRFRAVLADHLQVLPVGHSLVLSCPPTDADVLSPCIQFYGWDGDVVRCEVVSDEFLAAHRAWTDSGIALLRHYGFAEPTASEAATTPDVPVNWFLDRPRNWSDMMADAATRFLRDEWGVPHPAFVELDGAQSGELVEVCGGPPRDTYPTSASGTFDPMRATRTSDPAERIALVEATLDELLGHTPEPDEDGDYPFRLGPAWLYLCPTPEAPFVQILAPIASGITDAARAAVVVGEVNRRWPHVKLLLDEDRVLATIDVPVVPFVPQHVLDMLYVMEKFVVESADAVVADLHARPYLDVFGLPTAAPTDSPGGHELPAMLCTIAETVWDRGPDLSTDEVLAMCGHDRARIVRFLDVSRACESFALDRTLDDADPRRAASAGLDARVWRATTALLVSAHRRLASESADRSSSPGAQLDLFGTDTAGSSGDGLFD